jgi:hypothetical protein
MRIDLCSIQGAGAFDLNLTVSRFQASGPPEPKSLPQGYLGQGRRLR